MILGIVCFILSRIQKLIIKTVRSNKIRAGTFDSLSKYINSFLMKFMIFPARSIFQRKILGKCIGKV